MQASKEDIETEDIETEDITKEKVINYETEDTLTEENAIIDEVDTIMVFNISNCSYNILIFYYFRHSNLLKTSTRKSSKR